MIRPPFQARFQDYILGPNQATALTSVAAGQLLTEVTLQLDTDAPFLMLGRAMRCTYTASLTQAPLQGLATRFAGPQRDYKSTALISSALEMVYYGQFGNPKPIVPAVYYPAGSVIQVDLINNGASAIPDLTFLFRGVKLFPWDTVVGYTYPQPPAKFASQTFGYPVLVSKLGVSETRTDQPFTVKPDADFVLRALQGVPLINTGGRTFAEVSIQLMDHQKKPYSNDFVHFDFFGRGGAPATIPVGPSPSFVAPFGTGPGAPGLIYPEIYIPRNQQILYSIQRTDGSGGSNQAETFQFNLIGAKVFEK